MSQKSLAITAMIVVIAGAWWSIYSNLRPDRIDTGPHAAVGAAAARHTATLMQNSGRLVIVDADLGEFKILAPVNAAQIGSFKKALRKTGLQIAATERVPIAPPTMSRNGIFMEPGKLAELISRHANADALVLFVGLAGPGDLPARSATGGKPKLILVANYDRYYKALLQKRAIDLAIAPRTDHPPEEEKVGDPAEWFQRHYLVATPDDLARLPD